MAYLRLLEDMGDYLQSQGVCDYPGTATGWMLMLGMFQASGNQLVSLTEYGGNMPETTFRYTYPQVQIMVRGNQLDYQTPRDKVSQIFELLHCAEFPLPSDPRDNSKTLMAGSQIVTCYAKQTAPLLLGIDEQDRHQLAINFTMQIEG